MLKLPSNRFDAGGNESVSIIERGKRMNAMALSIGVRIMITFFFEWGFYSTAVSRRTLLQIKINYNNTVIIKMLSYEVYVVYAVPVDADFSWWIRPSSIIARAAALFSQNRWTFKSILWAWSLYTNTVMLCPNLFFQDAFDTVRLINGVDFLSGKRACKSEEYCVQMKYLLVTLLKCQVRTMDFITCNFARRTL